MSLTDRSLEGHDLPVQDLIRELTRSGDQTASLADLSQRHARHLAAAQLELVTDFASGLEAVSPGLAGPQAVTAWQAYLRDVSQRSVLFLDTLRQRGDSYFDHVRDGFGPLLAFDYDVVVDGKTLDRPVNYSLVRIRPPAGFAPTNVDGRPWVIIDPRAGHGSGIGGSKSESEVGAALDDGHPVYFVIFHPDPEPDQTLADVCAAEAYFLEHIRKQHPNSPKPLITGNCQGGWASMILAATHPDLMGPIVIAGAPLSYWAGEKGKNPFRYLGGMAGGAVPALFLSDLGAGKFDGAHLVHNFEQLNPGKTWWRKHYDLFSNIDEEAERFLDFEKWWSGFYFMNETEIRWIVENLFIGNKLTRGEAVLDDGTPIDLTRITAPVIVFASHGDNITPPQQALNWIPDLYGSVQEIQARGQIVVYTLHDSIGHLGIFVSAKVANAQHKQITSVVKTIESLSPGLYEMIIETDEAGYRVSFDARTIEDILAHDDGRDEEAGFEAVARFSEWATKTYELTWRPFLQAWVTPQVAETNKDLHPMRIQRVAFSGRNPMLTGLPGFATKARDERAPVSDDNPYRVLEQVCARAVESNLNLWRDTRDAWVELSFLSMYGLPWMQRLGSGKKTARAKQDLHHFPRVQAAIAGASSGGYSEAIVRMLVLLARARGSVRRDRLERSKRILNSRPPFDTMPVDERARLIHDQALIAEFAGEQAVSTLPVLLRDEVDRLRAVNLVLDIAGPSSEMDDATATMFKSFQYILRTRARDWQDPGEGLEATEPVSVAPGAASPTTSPVPAVTEAARTIPARTLRSTLTGFVSRLWRRD